VVMVVVCTTSRKIQGKLGWLEHWPPVITVSPVCLQPG